MLILKEILFTYFIKKRNIKKFVSSIFVLCNVFFAQNSLAVLNLPPPPTVTDPTKIISNADIKRLALVIAYIKQYYVKETNDKTLFEDSISGMISKLDPHSDYISAEDMKDLEMVTEGHFGGVGIEITPDQGVIRVISPLDDTPAYKAGIKAGDLILEINSKIVKDMTLRQALNAMRGPKGTKVTLTIARKNVNKPLNFTLTRDIIKVKTIKTRLLEPGYVYIRLAIFQEPTAKDLENAVLKLKKKGPIKGIILDLRNNPGGLLSSAIQVSGDFLDANKLKDNKLIVYTKGRFEGSYVKADVIGKGILSDVPMVVLINEGSASASEIVAGALQDHKRAVVVGKRSFGKGSVQTLLPLDDKTAIKITTSLYYTPSGRSIQAKGIEPDVVVDELQLAKDKNKPEFNIGESNLIDHLQNDNNAISKDDENLPDEVRQSKQAKLEQEAENKNIKLAQSDYQLYEAFHALKALVAFK